MWQVDVFANLVDYFQLPPKRRRHRCCWVVRSLLCPIVGGGGDGGVRGGSGAGVGAIVGEPRGLRARHHPRMAAGGNARGTWATLVSRIRRILIKKVYKISRRRKEKNCVGFKKVVGWKTEHIIVCAGSVFGRRGEFGIENILGGKMGSK